MKTKGVTKMQNILVCDDEKDIVEALRIYLNAEGYNVYQAYNGKEALDVCLFHLLQIGNSMVLFLVLLEVAKLFCVTVNGLGRQFANATVKPIFSNGILHVHTKNPSFCLYFKQEEGKSVYHTPLIFTMNILQESTHIFYFSRTSPHQLSPRKAL